MLYVELLEIEDINAISRVAIVLLFVEKVTVPPPRNRNLIAIMLI